MVRLYTDGSANPNPGPTAIGVLLVDDSGNFVKQVHRKLGRGTNNEAEVKALIEGVFQAYELGLKEIEAWTDSQLLQRQFSGAYNIKVKRLKDLHEDLKSAVSKLDKFTLKWHRREHPLAQAADDLSKGIVKNESEYMV